MRKTVTYKKYYVIVNDKVEEKNIRTDCIITDTDGSKYFYDDYGSGSIWWPVVNRLSDVYKRYLTENIKWAKDRLPWARKNSTEEVDMLKAIIKNNGEGRKPIIWQRRLEKYK